MIPVLIAGCTGWVHLPDEQCRTTRGVVLCTSLGNEASILHRPLAMIADSLARRGLTVLRLDYPGTGDSLQEDVAETLAGDMVRAVAAGAAWLREHAHLAEIALCGVRAGALIAAHAAPLVDDLWGLALMATPGSGRLFLRETLMTARAWDAMWLVNERSEHDGWFEAHGVWMTLAAKKSFEALDVRRLHLAPTPRALVMDPDGAPGAGTAAPHLRQLGVDVTEAGFTGYEALVRDALDNEVPVEAMGALGDWLSAGAVPAPKLVRIAPSPPHATGSGAIETVVQFGPDQRLSGVLTMPPDGQARLGMLIVNTGAHPHTGHSRFSVTFARRLAAAGVATLRMDASGLGDSDIRTGHRADVYSAEHVADAHMGFRFIQARTGRPVIVLGLCSGAYSAVRLWDEPALAGLVLVNLQKFFFDPGVPLRVIQDNTKRTTQFYMRNIRSRDTWRRLLSGDIDVGGISRALAGRGLRRARSAADPVLALAGVNSRYAEVRQWFRELGRRNIPVAYVLSGNDPGWDELEEYFGAGGNRLRRMPNVSLCRLENADHTLSHKSAREQLFSVISQMAEAMPVAAEKAQKTGRAALEHRRAEPAL